MLSQQRAIDQNRLQNWLANQIKAKKALILLDTCESGALVGGYLRSRTDIPASEAGVGRLHEATGRPVLTAAASGQFAHEGVIAGSGERHGVFTWALLDALRNGDKNGDGVIELSELVGHVQTVVPRLAAKLGGDGRAAIAAPNRCSVSRRHASDRVGRIFRWWVGWNSCPFNLRDNSEPFLRPRPQETDTTGCSTEMGGSFQTIPRVVCRSRWRIITSALDPE